MRIRRDRNMSSKSDASCKKFQANMFDNSRCQNCFKPRELHLMSDEEFEQVKAIYASWLCLAPEGTDFDNPKQRSRKWQRRFFILYEHGRLQFALDESPSTVPQGTLDLTLCTELVDAEARTGQKNALCLVTPEQELYIRGDSKEIINGWSQQLTVFLQTIKQKQRKKRKEQVSLTKPVCTTTTGGPDTEAAEENKPYSPELEEGLSAETADITTDQDLADSDAAADDGGDDDENSDEDDDASFDGADNDSYRDGNEENSDDDDEDSSDDSDGDEDLDDHANHHHHHQYGFLDSGKETSLDLSRNTCIVDPEQDEFDSLRTSRTTACDPFPPNLDLPSDSPLSSSTSSLYWDDTEHSAGSQTETSTLRRATQRHRGDDHDGDGTERVYVDCERSNMCQLSSREGRSRSLTVPVQNKRRARSLDGRTSENSMTPDLLNFKKGLLLYLDDHKQWNKYWFVLSAHSLRYYSDRAGEEASKIVGEIHLTACHNVTEHFIQRNYGFQIHTHKMVFTLAAMTAGIRQNWIQALTKNLQNLSAPDVASISDNHLLQVDSFSVPDVTQDSMTLSAPVSARCSPRTECEEQEWMDLQTEQDSRSRRRGREERRQRYAIMMGSSVCPGEERSSQDTPQQPQQERLREIEERWLEVERTAIRKENTVPLYPECQSKNTAELEQILEQYQNRMDKLTIQLRESANKNHLLESDQSTDMSWQDPTNDLRAHCEPQKNCPSKQNSMTSLTDKYQETKELLQLENLRRQQIKNQLGLGPSAQLSAEFINDSKCSLLNSETACDILSESLRPQLWCQASRDSEEECCDEDFVCIERAGLVENKHIGLDQAAVNQRTQEAQFLANQKGALEQHNQELLNQLAEADREIERLKAELFSLPNGHQPDLESIVDHHEELGTTSARLQEAQKQLADMKENLKDTQRTLQLRETMLRELGFVFENNEYTTLSQEDPDGLQCVQGLGTQPVLPEQTCNEPQTPSELFGESELQNGHMIMKDGESCNIKPDASSQRKGAIHGKDEEHQDSRRSREGIEYVLEKRIGARSEVLRMLLEVIRHLAGTEEPALEPANAQLKPCDIIELQTEKNMWENFVSAMEDNLSPSLENESAGSLLLGAKMKLEEVKMCLSALSASTNSEPSPLGRVSSNVSHYSTHDSLRDLDLLENFDGKIKEQRTERAAYNKGPVINGLIWRHLEERVEKRLTLLNLVASKLETFTMAKSQCDLKAWNQMNESHLDPYVSAAMEILSSCLVENVDVKQDRTLHVAEPVCSNAESVKVQTVNHDKMLEHSNVETREAKEEVETESVCSLRGRMQELEQLLSEGSERVASLQRQHEKDKDILKMKIVSAYEQGFAMLMASHQKATEDLLLKHQRDLELLQEEKERLLAEEAAATLTVIEAIKRVHHLELKKMLEKSSLEKSADSGLAEILKSHREELASIQRELDVLSGQYTHKCLESAHLAQALQAERKALQQCQHQNLALSTRNQELNNHLAEEIIRLLTMAKEDTCQLVGDKEQYELKIMLRVKESEIVGLEQEISTLKNELHTAQMDQKLAADRYKETQQDLSSVKDDAERQIGELREHLRLVYQALVESNEQKTPSSAFTAVSHPALSLLNS